MPSFRRSLAARLTLWYAIVFATTSTLAFALIYAILVSILRERTDDDLSQDIVEFAELMESGGIQFVEAEMDLELAGPEAGDIFLCVWDAEGGEVTRRGFEWPALTPPLAELAALVEDPEPLLRTDEVPAVDASVRTAFGPLGGSLVLQVSQSLEADEELIEAFRNGFLLTLTAVVLLGGPIGWFLARRALRGVEEIRRTADEIAEGALDRRVAARSPGDELDRLARTFNRMLDRIQGLIVGMREVTDNLAHDFRSPIARIRASAETVARGTSSREEWEALAADTIEECDRLMGMIDTTLDIAEAESGAARLSITDLDLADVVTEACDLFRSVADDRDITLEMELPSRAPFRGDRQKVQRIVANLIDNALKNTEPGGNVAIRLTDESEGPELAIEDTGVGMTEYERTRIFERFFRCERSRSGPGNGLGLSLALAFARAHGGTIQVRSEPGRGSRFTVSLPR